MLILFLKRRVQLFLQKGSYLDQLIEVRISDLFIAGNDGLEEGLLMYLQLVDQLPVVFMQLHCELVLNLYELMSRKYTPLIEEDVSIGGVRNLSPSIFCLKASEALSFNILLIEWHDVLIVELQPAVLLGLDERVVMPAI